MPVPKDLANPQGGLWSLSLSGFLPAAPPGRAAALVAAEDLVVDMPRLLSQRGGRRRFARRCEALPPVDLPRLMREAPFEEREALAERTMLAQIKRTFLLRNERLLRQWDSEAVDACLAADSLPAMLAAHAPFAMRRRGATVEEYVAAASDSLYSV